MSDSSNNNKIVENMMGVIETEKVPSKCPQCGGDMKETGTVIMVD
jgi:hypothetical protein